MERVVTGGRILVVDDDVFVRETVGQVLSREGYTVDYAEDGSSALRKVYDTRPDAILLDLMMPGMNGRQFLTALREDLGLTALPVLVMTAVHGIATHRSLAVDADDVVEKPFDVDELLNKVALALFRAREHQSVPDAGPADGVGDDVRTNTADGSGPSRAPAPEATGGVVLVVDDDRSSSRRIDALLNPHGYTVVWITRYTPDLPRLARVLEPRAILIDLHLPDVDGLTVLRNLRQDQTLDDVPILVVGVDLDPARSAIAALDAAAAAQPVPDALVVAFVTDPPVTARRWLV